MIIVGHKDLDNFEIEIIKNIDDIKTTRPNSIVAFKYDLEILKYCKTNNIKSLVVINNIKEAIFSNNLEATFIVTLNDAQKIQKIAENYMFDSKILQPIKTDDEVEEVALKGIDGVIYETIIKDII